MSNHLPVSCVFLNAPALAALSELRAFFDAQSAADRAAFVEAAFGGAPRGRWPSRATIVELALAEMLRTVRRAQRFAGKVAP